MPKKVLIKDQVLKIRTLLETVHYGHISPTWLTCGVIEAKLRSLYRCLSKKFETPIARTLPCSFQGVPRTFNLQQQKVVVVCQTLFGG